MAKLIKRGSWWHYDFRFQGQRHQGSTFLKNKEKAESFAAKLRSDLALGLVGITSREPAPVVSAFLKGAFWEWVRQHAEKPSTLRFYEQRVKTLSAFTPFQTVRLDRVDELAVQHYKEARLSQHLSPSTINGELRTLRKAMIFADTCGLIRYRKVHQLPGERNRDFILDGETEKRYLELAAYPLKQVAILMLDLGLRPEEAVSLRKSHISPDAVEIHEGKTRNAHRSIPQTHRTQEVFALCFRLFPSSPWIFPGTKGNHFTRGALSNLHIAVRAKHGFHPEFVLYSCRHTFGTRLAQSGANEFEIKRAMGHSSIKVSERYIHPSSEDIGLAMRRKELLDKMIRGETAGVTTEITATPKMKPN